MQDYSISPTNISIQIDNNVVENVEEFKFLGSVTPGSSSDIKQRIGLPSIYAFGRLKDIIWSHRMLLPM